MQSQPAARTRDEHDRFGNRVLLFRIERVFPLKVPRRVEPLLIARLSEVEIADIAEVSPAVAKRKAERAADERTMLIDHARAGVVEVRAGDGRGAAEEFVFRRRSRLAQIGVTEFREDFRCAPDDSLPACRRQSGETFRKDRDVRRADLEQAVAAERAAAAALQVLRLRLHYRPK